MMKKQLTTLVAGFILGAGAVTIYLAASGRLSSHAQLEFSPPTIATQPPMTESPIREASAQDTLEPDKQTDSKFVAADNTGTRPDTLPDGKPSGNLMVQSEPVQYLPPKLQEALRQYPTLDSKDKRASLANDVLGMTDAGASQQEVVQVLGTMFHEEGTTDLKLDILNDLIMLDDPSAIAPFVEGIDASEPKEVRTKAIEGLGNLGDNRAVPFLQELLTEQDSEIHDAAQNALDSVNSR